MKAIGVFDSGFGGLTILKSLQKVLPEHDFIYLGDNARAPYGEKSFELVNQYTKEAIDWLFAQGCPLIILACNTASALALRNIQQIYLKQKYDDKKRVLGVVRPTTEIIGNYSKSNSIGLLGTPATVESNSYGIEISKFFPNVVLHQKACPLWVPMIEHGTYLEEASKAVVEEDVESLLAKDPKIDTVLLACTHYPILTEIIKSYLPKHVSLISQGDIVAKSLEDYLRRHALMNKALSRKGQISFYTTDIDTKRFMQKSARFYPEITHVFNTKLNLNDS